MSNIKKLNFIARRIIKDLNQDISNKEIDHETGDIEYVLETVQEFFEIE